MRKLDIRKLSESKLVFLKDDNVLFKLGAIAISFGGKVYIKDSYWKYLDGNYYAKEALLVHEYVHLEQQRLQGKIWYVKYVLSKSFRYKQEIFAYKEELKYRISIGENKQELLETFAEFLSGKMYLYMIDFLTAYKDLEKE